MKPQTFQGICLREGSFLKSEVLLNLPTHMPSSKNHINHVYRHSIYIYIHIPFRFIPSPPTPREVSPWWLHIFFSTFHPSFTPETETSKFLELTTTYWTPNLLLTFAFTFQWLGLVSSKQKEQNEVEVGLLDWGVLGCGPLAGALQGVKV